MQDIQCLAVLSADRVWREDNGKIGMAGIFEHFNLTKFPAQVFPFFLYVRLSNVPAGKHELVTNVIEKNSKVVAASLTLNFETPEDQEILQLNYPVPPLVLPTPGEYGVNVSVNGVLLAEHIIKAILVPNQG
jgi:hypothetical protein